jgi:N-acetylglucosaminylphosphatidylinositol deacetylase
MKITTSYVLVIAHPDDESMFFLPSLYNLLSKAYTNNKKSNDSTDTNKDTNSVMVNTNVIHILCLSNGNYDGLGTKRMEELKDAASIISPSTTVTILNHPQLQDGPNESWPISCIETVMVEFLERHILKPTGTDHDNQKQNVVILTFDEGGVSGHTNHVDTYFGLMNFHRSFSNCAKSNIDEKRRIQILSEKINVQLQVLETVHNPIIKYFPFFELLFISIMSFFIDRVSHQHTVSGVEDTFNTKLNHYMFNPLLVWRAMKAHHTQFVWYRRLFIVFSRYSYINTLKSIDYSEEIKKIK